MIKTKVGKIWKAQFKISAIIIYYTLVGVMGLATYTYFEANETFQENFTEYILCESGGQSSDCVLNLNVGILDALGTTVVVMVSFLPVLAILFSCDPQACRRKNARDLEMSTTTTLTRSMAASAIRS